MDGGPAGTPQAWGRANTDAGASLQRAEAVLRQLREAEAAWLVSLAAGAGDPVPSPAPSARPSVLVTPARRCRVLRAPGPRGF